MPRSIRACRTAGNVRRGPSSVRWVTFAIIAAHISPADKVLRNDTQATSQNNEMSHAGQTPTWVGSPRCSARFRFTG